MRERRLAREVAVQSLYEASQAEISFEAALRSNVARRQASEGAAAYAERLLRSYEASSSDIVATIEKHLENWAWQRVALVDRCVLQVGTVEILHFDDVPLRVIIDEAVDIARKFGTEESGKFVNGVLDRIARNAQGEIRAEKL